MVFRLGVASLGVAILAYVFGPSVALCVMVPVGGLIFIDSQKAAGVGRTDP